MAHCWKSIQSEQSDLRSCDFSGELESKIFIQKNDFCGAEIIGAKSIEFWVN